MLDWAKTKPYLKTKQTTTTKKKQKKGLEAWLKW
jgi:hypothetical protein